MFYSFQCKTRDLYDNLKMQYFSTKLVNFILTFSAPYCLYQEFLENGSLQDILLQTARAYQSEHKDDGDERIYLSHLIDFAKDIANGLEFLHSNKVSETVLQYDITLSAILTTTI